MKVGWWRALVVKLPRRLGRSEFALALRLTWWWAEISIIICRDAVSVTDTKNGRRCQTPNNKIVVCESAFTSFSCSCFFVFHN